MKIYFLTVHSKNGMEVFRSEPMKKQEFETFATGIWNIMQHGFSLRVNDTLGNIIQTQFKYYE